MSVEELKGGNGTVKMQFKGEGLDKKDLFGMLLQEHGTGLLFAVDCCSSALLVVRHAAHEVHRQVGSFPDILKGQWQRLLHCRAQVRGTPTH